MPYGIAKELNKLGNCSKRLISSTSRKRFYGEIWIIRMEILSLEDYFYEDESNKKYDIDT